MHDEQITRPLPAIMIPASDYDRLAALADAVPPSLAAYFQRELVRASIVADAHFDARAVRVGSRVTYREEPGQRTRTVTLAWPDKANLDKAASPWPPPSVRHCWVCTPATRIDAAPLGGGTPVDRTGRGERSAVASASMAACAELPQRMPR
ncbi:MAG: hypothetical protein U1F30_12345 [Steroidobacteraceae bacterium]